MSTRTLSAAIEEALIHTFTRSALEVVLADELRLTWRDGEQAPAEAESKRDVVRGYIAGWSVPEMVAFASRLAAEVPISAHLVDPLRELIAEYERGGGVGGPTKNLIFAANGPEPAHRYLGHHGPRIEHVFDRPSKRAGRRLAVTHPRRARVLRGEEVDRRHPSEPGRYGTHALGR